MTRKKLIQLDLFIKKISNRIIYKKEDFTSTELAYARRCFELDPESPWSAFCELKGYFGDMPLEKMQDLYDIIASELEHEGKDHETGIPQ